VGDSAALAAALERSLTRVDVVDAPRQQQIVDRDAIDRSWVATAVACERIAGVV
jgi:hypothetical protein